MAVSDDDDEESDMDYIPGNDEEAYVSACSTGEFVSGDDEVVAAAPASPSPRRSRRKRKRRGQGPPHPAPRPVPRPGSWISLKTPLMPGFSTHSARSGRTP